jgi:hypothetical protein
MQIIKHNTLFFLDWDDTLFPTNWVIKNNINLSSSKNRDRHSLYFQELDRVLSKFLRKLDSLGKIIIITNALPDWITISSLKLPDTYHLLRDIEIISARGTYRDKSNKTMDWKTMAFRDVIDREFQSTHISNVISIGDAEYEYQALISLSNRKKDIKYLKSVRFVNNPSHDVLIDQLEVLNNAIPKIWNKYKNLDLKFNQI